MIPLLTNQVVRVRKSKRRTMIEPSKKLMSIVRRDNPSPIDFLDRCKSERQHPLTQFRQVGEACLEYGVTEWQNRKKNKLVTR